MVTATPHNQYKIIMSHSDYRSHCSGPARATRHMINGRTVIRNKSVSIVFFCVACLGELFVYSSICINSRDTHVRSDFIHHSFRNSGGQTCGKWPLLLLICCVATSSNRCIRFITVSRGTVAFISCWQNVAVSGWKMYYQEYQLVRIFRLRCGDLSFHWG